MTDEKRRTVIRWSRAEWEQVAREVVRLMKRHRHWTLPQLATEAGKTLPPHRRRNRDIYQSDLAGNVVWQESWEKARGEAAGAPPEATQAPAAAPAARPPAPAPARAGMSIVDIIATRMAEEMRIVVKQVLLDPDVVATLKDAMLDAFTTPGGAVAPAPLTGNGPDHGATGS